MAYAVVIRNGVWVRTLATMVRPTDMLARGRTYQDLLRHNASLGRAGPVGTGRYAGLHPARECDTRACEANVSLHLDRRDDEKRRTEYAFITGGEDPASGFARQGVEEGLRSEGDCPGRRRFFGARWFRKALQHPCNL